MPFFSDREIYIGKLKHAAYKPCYWFEQSLRTGGRRHCYKHVYGIDSFGCIQSTSYKGCNIACVFCWRDVEERPKVFKGYDEPEYLVEEFIRTQEKIVEESLERSLENWEICKNALVYLSRVKKSTIHEISERLCISKTKVREAFIDLYNSELVIRINNNEFEINQKIIKDCINEEEASNLLAKYFTTKEEIIDVHNKAKRPKHVAISYDGEPTMYPYIGKLIQAYRKRGISTFLVTNGTYPDRIKQMLEEGNLPTQLYVSLVAPDPETYIKVTSSLNPYLPSTSKHWERLNETLSLLSKLPCRTVIRITAVKYLNMIKPEEYRKIILDSNPDFFEIKGYSITGLAPRMLVRLGKELPIYDEHGELMKKALAYSPNYEEVYEFARQISDNFRIFPFITGNIDSSQVVMAVKWKDIKNVQFELI